MSGFGIYILRLVKVPDYKYVLEELGKIVLAWQMLISMKFSLYEYLK